MNSKRLASTNDCTGCGVCVYSCPRNAIQMFETEEGFWYPEINPDECIECDSCNRNCHIMNKNNDANKERTSLYGGFLNDASERGSVSSGGFATAISKYFINKGGVVWGVAYSNDFRCTEYVCIQSLDDIEKLKNSKYAQASIPDYGKIINQIKSNIKVLFIGLPCQCAALSSVIDKLDNNTISNCTIVSLVCQGQTSAKGLSIRINELERKYKSKIVSINMRYKKNGHVRPTCIMYAFENRKKLIEPFCASSIGYYFNYMKRLSCYNCNYKYPNIKADVIIGDFWGWHKSDGIIKGQDNAGESMIVVLNKKFVNVITELSEEGFTIYPVDWYDLEKKNPSLFRVAIKKNMKIRELMRKAESSDEIKSGIPFKKRTCNYLYYYARRILPDSLWNKIKSINKGE